MRSSLTRFIPANEAGAGFAGDATGLLGGGAGWVGLQRCGEVTAWRARLPFHARFTLTARAGDTGFTRVSRAPKPTPNHAGRANR